MSRFTVAQATAQVADWVDLYKTQQRLFAKLASRVEHQGGEYFSKDYESLDLNIRSYGRYESHTAAESGDPVRATWRMGTYMADDQVSGLDKEFQGAVGKLDSGTLRKIEAQAIANLKSKFTQRFKSRVFWDAAGTAYNGGGGVEPMGLKLAIVASPSTGTYAGISRVTYSNWRNYQISGASGPSGSWVADAWERILTAKMGCVSPDGTRGKPDLMLCNVGPAVQIMNKAFSQNTNVGGQVGTITSVAGMEIIVDDDATASSVYLFDLSSLKVKIPTERSTKNFGIEMWSKSNLPDQVRRDDTVFVMDFVGTPVCEFPKANAIITSAS